MSQQAKILENENKALKSELDTFKLELLTTQNKIVSSTKKNSVFSSQLLNESIEKTKGMVDFVGQNRIIDETVRLKLELEQVSMECRKLERALRLLKNENERLVTLSSEHFRNDEIRKMTKRCVTYEAEIDRLNSVLSSRPSAVPPRRR